MVQMKVIAESISYKKLSGRLPLSPQEVEIGGSKDSNFWNNSDAMEWETRLTYLGLNAAKINDCIKKWFK